MNTKTSTVLARKYRPMTFADVVGQDHVKNAIKNSIASDKLHSVYLLSGTRGIGKTTIARIFAKAMNCENYEQHQEPCGTCESCESFKHDGNPGIIEIDAASRSTVKDTREIIDFVDTPVMVGNYNVFIIDEVHMLSDSSFNALLKTLEEPPERVKFILCTTDPQKIPATVLSRCLHFHLRPITAQQIYDHLCNLLTIEGIEFEERAVYLIAQLANGSLRDSLSLTDQAIALGNNNITLKVVHAMVGMLDDSFSNQLVVSLINRNADQAFQLVQEIARQQPDWKLLISQILNNLSNLTIIPLLPEVEQHKFKLENEDLYQLIQEHSQNRQTLLEVAQILYDIFVHAVKLIDITSNPEQVMKLTIIRGLAFSASAEYVGNLEIIWQQQQLEQQAQQSKKKTQQESVKKSNRRAVKVLEAVNSAESYGSSIYNCRSLILLNSEHTSNSIDYSTIINKLQQSKTQSEGTSNSEATALSLQSVTASTESSDFTGKAQDALEAQATSQVVLDQDANVEIGDQGGNHLIGDNNALHQPNVTPIASLSPLISTTSSKITHNLNSVSFDLSGKDYTKVALLPAYISFDNYKIVVNNMLNKFEEVQQDIVGLGFITNVSHHADVLMMRTDKYNFLPNLVTLYQNFRHQALGNDLIKTFKNFGLSDNDLRFLFEVPLKFDSQSRMLTLILAENLGGLQEYVDNLRSKLSAREYQLQISPQKDVVNTGEFLIIKDLLAQVLDHTLALANQESEEEARLFAKLFEHSLDTVDLHE